MTTWPLADLHVRTPRLHLALPTPAELEELAAVGAAGVHDPAVQPFSVAWTDVEPAQRALATMQWHWRSWADIRPQQWHLELVVRSDGAVVGTQALAAKDFSVTREVSTGSWLGLPWHGRGIGTEMRAAALHVAALLGAQQATSGAYAHNPASLRVSEKLGYRPDGIEVHAVREKPATLHRLRLDLDGWTCPVPVEVSGLDACRPLLGAEG